MRMRTQLAVAAIALAVMIAPAFVSAQDRTIDFEGKKAALHALLCVKQAIS